MGRGLRVLEQVTGPVTGGSQPETLSTVGIEISWREAAPPLGPDREGIEAGAP